MYHRLPASLAALPRLRSLQLARLGGVADNPHQPSPSYSLAVAGSLTGACSGVLAEHGTWRSRLPVAGPVLLVPGAQGLPACWCVAPGQRWRHGALPCGVDPTSGPVQTQK